MTPEEGTVQPALINRKPGRPRSQTVKQRILDAVFELLSESGFDQLTIEAVARKAEVGKPTIYRYWATKTELAVYSLLRAAPPLSSQAKHISPQAGRSHIATLIADTTVPPFGIVLLNLADGTKHHPALAAKIQKQYLQPRRALVWTQIMQDVTRGVLRPDTDPDTIMDTLFGMALYKWLISSKPLSVRETRALVNTVWKLYSV